KNSVGIYLLLVWYIPNFRLLYTYRIFGIYLPNFKRHFSKMKQRSAKLKRRLDEMKERNGEVRVDWHGTKKGFFSI
ncbi:MAG: hypothetical protein LBO06_08540, partial [Bacteroidales bacterium]|nr:hypothetical protein [Bacteroidales bacterium]